MRKQNLLITMLTLLLLPSCNSNDELTGQYDGTTDGLTEVLFATHLNRVRTTRAMMDDDALHSSGFGVYAFYTEDQPYPSSNTLKEPNFFCDQPVEWNTSTAVRSQVHSDGTGAWVYAPVKYWPNELDPADNQDHHSGDNPAHGILGRRYVSFFAYAPFMPQHTTATPGQTGIVAVSAKDNAGDPWVDYTIEPSYDPEQYQDLLWAVTPKNQGQVTASGNVQGGNDRAGLPQANLTKTTTKGYIPLEFRHALSLLKLQVLGVFDEVSPATGRRADSTRILVNSIVVDTHTPDKGRLNLNNDVAYQARWQPKDDATEVVYTIGKSDLNPQLCTDKTLTDYLSDPQHFFRLPAGVTDTLKLVLPHEDDQLPLLPVSGDGTTLRSIDVTIDYDVITYDPKLVRNVPAGFSIVHNRIKGQAMPSQPYQANHIYTLRLLVGMTSVKFDVTTAPWESGGTIEVPEPDDENTL